MQKVVLSKYLEGCIIIPLGHQVYYFDKMDNRPHTTASEFLPISQLSCHGIHNKCCSYLVSRIAPHTSIFYHCRQPSLLDVA